MIEYTVRISDNGEIYVNGELHDFDNCMDTSDKEDDLNEKALVALADAMGYEVTVLFDEMSSRLWELDGEEDWI